MTWTSFSRRVLSLSSVLSVAIGGTAFAVTPNGRPLVPSFQPAPCGFKDVPADWDAKNGLTCGWVKVKAHHEQADSATLRLWVFKMAAVTPSNPPKPPLMRLVGGPLPAAITPTSPRSPTAPIMLGLRATRDLVYFDYRGMGNSEPKLACKVGPVAGATDDELLRSQIAQYAECRRQIEAAGIDLSAVNAAAAAQDVEDIAQAMGYQTYDVWGVSFGTLPELYLIGRHPTGLRAAIVGVPYPPDATSHENVSTFGHGLTAMQRECDRTAACHARFPDMAGSLGRAMDRLDRQGLAGPSRRLLPIDLFQSLSNMSMDPDSLPLVPLAIDFAEKGSSALIAKWISATKGDDSGIPDTSDTQGVAVAAAAMECGALVGRPLSREYKAAARRYPYLAKATIPTDAGDRICDVWKTAPPPRDLGRPIRSNIPVLFYYARLDTAVTVSDTLRLARSFPHSTVIEVPGVGHNFTDYCLLGLYTAFLDNPSGVLHRSCTAHMKPIKIPLDGFEKYLEALATH